MKLEFTKKGLSIPLRTWKRREYKTERSNESCQMDFAYIHTHNTPEDKKNQEGFILGTIHILRNQKEWVGGASKIIKL